MSLHRLFRLSLSTPAGILMSCGAPGPSPVIPVDLYQPVSRQLPATPTRSWWTTTSNAVAQAAPMPVLDSAALPPGARELRLSAGVGGMIWHPIPLLRLVEWDNRVAGELYLYWPRLRDSTGEEMVPHWVKHRQSGCRAVHQTTKWATCRIPPRAGTSWRVVADSIDALRIWELPVGPEERRGSHVSDQDGVMAEMLIGNEYRRFRYYHLDMLTGTDVTRVRAAANLVEHLVPDRR